MKIKTKTLNPELLRKLLSLFKQFSFPGGIPSHVAPETPGSIHEGGELGYSLSHAFGAAFDNPDLLVACVVGDGEAETGPLATSWHSNKFLNPVHDGAVLPILHLNGYKIAGPTVLARIPQDELESLFRGYGYKPYFVEGGDPMKMHQLMAATLDVIVADIRSIQRDARANGFNERPRWPMIILCSPKGWTGPKVLDGKPTEGTFRSHQVPMGEMSHPGHVKLLEKWMKSYRTERTPPGCEDANHSFAPTIRVLRFAATFPRNGMPSLVRFRNQTRRFGDRLPKLAGGASGGCKVEFDGVALCTAPSELVRRLSTCFQAIKLMS